MNAGTRQILHVTEQAPRKINSNGDRRTTIGVKESAARVNGRAGAGAKPRVFVAAENRLLREALSRMLVKSGEIDVVGTDMEEPFRAEDLLEEETDVLLLSSHGIRNEDLTAVRKVRTTAPKVRILLIGVTGEQAEFLQCVRAGVRGYLPRDASAEEVVEGVRALQGGEAICPGRLCATLFRYFEREATSFPSASVRQRLGLTRRHKQRDRQSLLSLGANGEKPLVSDEAEDRRRGPPGYRTGVPNAWVHAVVFSFKFSVLRTFPTPSYVQNEKNSLAPNSKRKPHGQYGIVIEGVEVCRRDLNTTTHRKSKPSPQVEFSHHQSGG
jgi:DNA-binding NarL/FixJ family response regulator